MQNSLESKGKTVQEAITNGLDELNLSFDQVDIEILHEGKGFLGLGKNAVVRLTVKQDDDTAEAVKFLDDLFEKMGISASAEGLESDDENTVNININGDSTGILIGRRGETLDSIQYIASLVINKGNDKYKRVHIDTENYRKKRESSLISLAHKLAERVDATGKRVVLEPMNPYERRILHAMLHDHPTVTTVSEGEEPYRRVIIKKKKSN